MNQGRLRMVHALYRKQAKLVDWYGAEQNKPCRGSSVVEQTPEERRVGCSIHPRGTTNHSMTRVHGAARNMKQRVVSALTPES